MYTYILYTYKLNKQNKINNIKKKQSKPQHSKKEG